MSVSITKRMPIGYGLLTVITVLACLGSYIVVLISGVEASLALGPIIAILAGVLWLAAAKHQHPQGIRIAYFILFFIFAMFLLTWIAGWGPSQAYVAFAVFGSGFVITTFVLSNRSFANAPKRYKDWQCLQCGYPLRGLTSTRCPECGNQLHEELLERYRDSEP